MLTEAEMAAMADYFEDIYTKACDDIMAEIGKNIARTQDLTPAQAKAIQRMHLHSADMNRLEGILKQTSGKSFEDIKAVYDYTVADSYEWARPFYQNRGLTKIPARFNQSLKQMLNAISQSSGKTLENLSRTTTIGVETSKGFQPLGKFYKDTINKSILSVSTGTESYQKAVRKAVQELGGSGIRVQYESGYTRRLDSAVRQNVLDGMSYIAQESARIHGEAFGADGWELSAHAPCAPDHLPYQGLQYSKAEYEDLQASLARPIGEWNCRHVAYPIVLGVSGAANSKEELAEMERYSNEKIEIDGREYTRYECTQLQRKLETEMRKAQEQKILYKNAGMKDLEREASQRMNQLANKYKEVSDKAGLPTRAERTRIVQGRLKEKVINREVLNRNGEVIIFDDRLSDRTKELLKNLSEEYNTRLYQVSLGSKRSAGSVDMGCSRMRLSSQNENTVLHEFAHTLSSRRNLKAGTIADQGDSEFYKELAKIQRRYRKDVGMDTKRWISSYEHGSTGIDEFMAEAFAQAKLKEMGLDIPAYYGKDFTYSDEVLKLIDKYFKKDSALTTNVKTAIINKDTNFELKLPKFTEKDLKNQSPASIRRSIRKFERRIDEHENKIANPADYVKDWADLDARKQKGTIRHWEKEIRNFKTSIATRKEELKLRGEFIE